MTVTLTSSRFGEIEISADRVLDFPSGLIGLGGSRYTLLQQQEDSAFAWLQSLDDPDLAVPVTNPWRFFADYEVEVSDDEVGRIGITSPDATSVFVTVRAAAELEDFCANLRAPILIQEGRGHQIINQAPGCEVRAPLFPAAGVQHTQAA